MIKVFLIIAVIIQTVATVYALRLVRATKYNAVWILFIIGFSLLSVDIRNINPVADAVAAGAMTMFMPHGLGHGLGMDVHDCEAMGERSFDFSSIAQRAAKSATCIYRAAWRLEPGTVMTDEPGLYFIPALIDKCRAEGLYKGIVDYDALEGYRDFGGIRIEDDILVTESGSRMLGDKKIPVTVEELEAVVGR